MSDALWQNSFYIGNNFNDILYGVELVLYFMTMQKLVKPRDNRKKSDKFFMFFSTALLVLITIYVSTQAILGEEMWIVNANYPGGSAAYYAAEASVWYQTMGSAANVILNLMCDGLMIYRCMIVWNDYRVIVVPCFLWVATLALGIVELYMTGSPNGDFFAGLAAKVTLAYCATSIGLNVTVTSIICGRLLFFAKKSQARLGRDISQTYFQVLSIVVESALPYSLSGVAFLVSYGLNSEISVLFLSLYGMFTVISPQMLVLRVVAGRAWTRDNSTEMMSAIEFSSRPNHPHTQSSYGNDDTVEVHLRSLAHSEMSSADVNKV